MIVAARLAGAILLSAAIPVVIGARSQSGQEDRIIDIRVDDPRPLAMVIQALERRYSWVITYEDPSYVHASDVADLTHRVRGAADKTTPRMLGVRGGPFDFRYPIPDGVDRPRASEVLDALLEQHHLSGNPGLFRVLRTGAVSHVVPAKRKGANGALEDRGSILDTNISVPDGDRSVYEMLLALVDTLSSVRGERIGLGILPTNLLAHVRVQGGARKEPARTVLLRTLEATKSRPPAGATEWKLSWQLLRDPTPPGLAVLNIHVVR